METFHICDEIEAAHVIRLVDDRLHLATISTIDRNYAEYEVERSIRDSVSLFTRCWWVFYISVSTLGLNFLTTITSSQFPL